MDRAPGLSVRLKLTLSYAGFLMVAGRPAHRGRVGVPAAVRARPGDHDSRVGNPTRSIRPRSGPLRSRPLRPLARFRAQGGAHAGVPAGARVAGRVDSRRPDARAAAPHHRCDPRGREWIALPPDRVSPAGRTSFASSPTRSTACWRGSKQHVAEQQRFAANASHELRTPLAITQTLLDVAAKDPSRDTGELIGRLRVVNTRAIDLTEALLLLSRAGQRSFTPELVDLSLAAEEAIETLLPLAEARGVSIETAGGPAGTTGSPALLFQMTTNLVHNAIVHNLPEGAPSGSAPSFSRRACCSSWRTPATCSAHSSSPRSPSRSSAAPNGFTPRIRVSVSAWPSSPASPRRTTEPSPSPPVRPAGCGSRCSCPHRPPCRVGNDQEHRSAHPGRPSGSCGHAHRSRQHRHPAVHPNRSSASAALRTSPRLVRRRSHRQLVAVGTLCS